MLTDNGTIFFVGSKDLVTHLIVLSFAYLFFKKYLLNTCIVSYTVLVNVVLRMKKMILAIKIKYLNHINKQNIKDKIQERILAKTNLSKYVVIIADKVHIFCKTNRDFYIFYSIKH